jgi:hypothetical protein
MSALQSALPAQALASGAHVEPSAQLPQVSQLPDASQPLEPVEDEPTATEEDDAAIDEDDDAAPLDTEEPLGPTPALDEVAPCAAPPPCPPDPLPAPSPSSASLPSPSSNAIPCAHAGSDTPRAMAHVHPATHATTARAAARTPRLPMTRPRATAAPTGDAAAHRSFTSRHPALLARARHDLGNAAGRRASVWSGIPLPAPVGAFSRSGAEERGATRPEAPPAAVRADG